MTLANDIMDGHESSHEHMSKETKTMLYILAIHFIRGALRRYFNTCTASVIDR